MRKKQPVPVTQKFSNADPLALRLLQRLLAFDPKDRPTAEEALADPYFKGLGKIEREPSCQPISKLEFEFERRRLTKDDIRELLYREILEYHPQLLKDYVNGNEGTNFLYPSAIGQFRKQFAYLEENGGRTAPVMPLERKHVSLPRPTVHSNFIPPSMPPKVSRPPPRLPSAKPGRVIGSAVQSDNSKNVRDTQNVRICYGDMDPPQNISPHCFFRTNMVLSIPESENPMLAKQPLAAMAVGTNANPYYQPKPKVDMFNDRITVDAKLLQAKSQFDQVGAITVAFSHFRG